jgi:hypothetical protein
LVIGVTGLQVLRNGWQRTIVAEYGACILRVQAIAAIPRRCDGAASTAFLSS